MAESADKPKAGDETPAKPAPAPAPTTKRRSRWRIVGIVFLVLLGLLGAARLAMPRVLLWYVNRTINQSELYRGKIDDIDVHLWRGAYTIKMVRLVKITGNVPVPLFSADQVDLAVQWDALLKGRLVGQIVMRRPELNFVAAADDSQGQTGAGEPWLKIIRDLFPFRINAARVHDGQIHFRAFHTDPPVDVYLSEVEASVDNLTNIRDEVTPMVSTVKAKALAMGQAQFEYQMKLNPFSYRPTFELAVRLVGLDVTKINTLARTYGRFDFERGFFDLVVELDAREGQLRGYVKPLFRNLQVFSLEEIGKEDPLRVFWEAVVGLATGLLKNPPRDQFGTMIPLRGDLTNPNTNIFEIVGNVLRNAFVRAYLPRFRGVAPDVDWLQFEKASVTEPSAIGNAP